MCKRLLWRSWLLVLVTFLSLTWIAPAHGQPKPSRVDALGDRLPEGAVARLGTTRLRHEHGAWAIAISPDGTKVATGIADRPPIAAPKLNIVIWDAKTGKAIHQLSLDGGPRDLCFSSDGTKLAGVGKESLAVWNVDTGNVLWQGQGDKCDFPATTLATCGDHLAIWSMDTNDVMVNLNGWTKEAYVKGEIREWATGRKILHGQIPLTTMVIGNHSSGSGGGVADISSDGSKAAITFQWSINVEEQVGKTTKTVNKIREKFLAFIDLKKKQIERKFEGFAEKSPCHGTFLGNGQFYLQPEETRLWRIDVNSGEKQLLTDTFPKSAYIRDVLPDGKTLFMFQNREICLWDLDQHKEVIRYPVLNYAYSVISKDGKTLAVNNDYVVELRELLTGRKLHSWPGHQRPVTDLHFASNDTLVSKDDVGHWHYWNLKSQQCQKSLLLSEQYSADGYVVAADLMHARYLFSPKQGNLELRAAENHKKIRELPRLAKTSWNDPYDFLPDRKRIMFRTSSDGKTHLHFIDVATGQKVSQISAKTARGWRSTGPMPIQADGSRLALQTDTEEVQIFDIQTGDLLKKLRDPIPDSTHEILRWGSVQCFSTDGRYLAAIRVYQALTEDLSYDGKMVIWDLVNDRIVQRILSYPIAQGRSLSITAVSFSPDSRLLYTSTSAEPDIFVWEVASGKLRGKLKGHLQGVTALAFSPDNRYLASGSPDTTILIWDLHRPLQPGITLKDELSPEDLEAHWHALAGSDAEQADTAIWALIHAHKQSVPFLRQHLSPRAGVPTKTILGWIADLRSAEFRKRSLAMAKLQELGRRAEKYLRAELKTNPPLEARQRLEQLLRKLDDVQPSPSWLREQRALEVLEKIGTVEARQVLQRLSEGVADDPLTEEARLCLQRLDSKR